MVRVVLGMWDPLGGHSIQSNKCFVFRLHLLFYCYFLSLIYILCSLGYEGHYCFCLGVFL